MTTYNESEDDGREVDDENFDLPAIPEYPSGWNEHKMDLLFNASIKLKENEYVNIYTNHKRSNLDGYVFDGRTRYCAPKKRQKDFEEFINFIQIKGEITSHRKYIRRMRLLRKRYGYIKNSRTDC
jgi:hypothetical protein